MIFSVALLSQEEALFMSELEPSEEGQVLSSWQSKSAQATQLEKAPANCVPLYRLRYSPIKAPCSATQQLINAAPTKVVRWGPRGCRARDARGPHRRQCFVKTSFSREREESWWAFSRNRQLGTVDEISGWIDLPCQKKNTTGSSKSENYSQQHHHSYQKIY